MAYRLTYSWDISWVGAGSGPMTGRDGSLAGGAGAQIIGGVNSGSGQIAGGSGAGGTLAAADVTSLTNGMAADVAAQLNVPALLNTVNRWPTGNP